ncbi:winged helix-turn-helix domain-containing protein [uncultured Methanomethylovorans sp.]|uniref:helix-turn-helix transcriptional regulator n=1 Tax=uncultured Methanomethylovorans sp. TaxID=183759 RepID=UPI002AA61722|nr:winged helix-turn-helix domain-containing protein [uncultured Methanomethylovorans sp.]
MRKALIDVLFASDQRKEVLLLLQEETKETENLLTSLKTTRKKLLSQMKVLEEHHLVSHYDDSYELTAIGKLVVDEIVPLLDKIEVLDTDIDYWGTRKLDFVPPHLFKRLLELKECQIINPYTQSIYARPLDIYGTDDEFQETSKNSDNFCAVTAFFHPHFISMFTEMLHGKVKINIIVTPNVVDIIRNQYQAEYIEIIKSKLFNLFVYPKKIDFVSFAYNEYYLLMRLLTNEGNYDYKYMLSSSQNALDWGKVLFEYYLKDSVPLARI